MVMSEKTLLFISQGGTNSACAALLVRAAGRCGVTAFAGYTDKQLFEVDRTMVTLMAEDGLDLETVTPLYYMEDLTRDATHVINIGTNVETDKPTYKWDLPSSDGMGIREIRELLEDMRWKVKNLLDEVAAK